MGNIIGNKWVQILAVVLVLWLFVYPRFVAPRIKAS